MIIPALTAHLAQFLEAMYSSISAAYWGITDAYLSETTSQPHKMRGYYWGKMRKNE